MHLPIGLVGSLVSHAPRLHSTGAIPVDRLTLAERNPATRTACISNTWSRPTRKRVISIIWFQSCCVCDCDGLLLPIYHVILNEPTKTGTGPGRSPIAKSKQVEFSTDLSPLPLSGFSRAHVGFCPASQTAISPCRMRANGNDALPSSIARCKAEDSPAPQTLPVKMHVCTPTCIRLLRLRACIHMHMHSEFNASCHGLP